MRYNFIDKFYHEYPSLFSTAFKTISRNLKKKKFEPEVEALNKIVGPGQTCIDVGGAYGRYAFPLSMIVGPEGKIFSFEPGRYSYRVLRIVKWFHRLKNVFIYKLAISDKKGSVNLCLPVKKTGKIGASLAFISETGQDNAVCEAVDMTTIDDFCKDNGVNGVSFIKCDTEGSEFLVFRGAQGAIKRSRPVVLTEVDIGNMSRYGYKPSDLEDFFSPLGYKIFAYKSGGFVSIKRIVENGNYFFVPEGRSLNSVTG